jgi:hypothetical protein
MSDETNGPDESIESADSPSGRYRIMAEQWQAFDDRGRLMGCSATNFVYEMKECYGPEPLGAELQPLWLEVEKRSSEVRSALLACTPPLMALAIAINAIADAVESNETYGGE